MSLSNATITLPAVERRISPFLYSGFIEHFSDCVNGGIWVGPDSETPNDDGLRTGTVEALAELALPAMRWPGGNWAEYHHWRDGIGPRGKRPLRYNVEWSVSEDHAFGTHEFLRFCEAIGSEPYLVLNVGSGTVQEAREWVEYCNSPHDTEITRLRAANGQPHPWKVPFWEVGNESWHSGGQCRAQDYIAAYRRYSNKLKFIGTGDRDVRPAVKLVACGCCARYPDWNAAFLAGMKEASNMLHMVDYIDDHFYQGRDIQDETDFSAEAYYRLFNDLSDLDTHLSRTIELLKEYSVGLILGEWAAWHDGVWIDNQFHQYSSMRDAIFAARAFHLFHRYSPELYMTNMSMTVNALQCLVTTNGAETIKTPTYHIYRMFKPHRDGVACDCRFETPIHCAAPDRTAHEAVSVSATVKGTQLFLSAVNIDPEAMHRLRFRLPHPLRILNHQAEQLFAPEIRTGNTTESPNAVTPRPWTAILTPEGLEIELPPHSVSTVDISYDTKLESEVHAEIQSEDQDTVRDRNIAEARV
jgi:alpha-N-arabinofuranosidase